jgi:hypothetical protein
MKKTPLPPCVVSSRGEGDKILTPAAASNTLLVSARPPLCLAALAGGWGTVHRSPRGDHGSQGGGPRWWW